MKKSASILAAGLIAISYANCKDQKPDLIPLKASNLLVKCFDKENTSPTKRKAQEPGDRILDSEANRKFIKDKCWYTMDWIDFQSPAGVSAFKCDKNEHYLGNMTIINDGEVIIACDSVADCENLASTTNLQCMEVISEGKLTKFRARCFKTGNESETFL